MYQPVLDLFGQVPVTRQDIDAWLESVPRIAPDSPRAAWYIQAYNVPGKIAAAKLNGEFEHLTHRAPQAYWWHRFNWG